jgi:hypothetical protein
MQLEEKEVKIGNKYVIKIHELTVEEEGQIKQDARRYERQNRSFTVDPGALDASIILHSVVKETWPSDFGEFSLENIKKLPSKYFRKLLPECEKLNSIKQESADFLEEASSSPGKKTKQEP